MAALLAEVWRGFLVGARDLWVNASSRPSLFGIEAAIGDGKGEDQPVILLFNRPIKEYRFELALQLN
jgi:hypothetical protein